MTDNPKRDPATAYAIKVLRWAKAYLDEVGDDTTIEVGRLAYVLESGALQLPEELRQGPARTPTEIMAEFRSGLPHKATGCDCPICRMGAEIERMNVTLPQDVRDMFEHLSMCVADAETELDMLKVHIDAHNIKPKHIPEAIEAAWEALDYIDEHTKYLSSIGEDKFVALRSVLPPRIKP